MVHSKPREFKLERGVPVPKKGGGRQKGQTKYPFAIMKIGDSFMAASSLSGIGTVSRKWARSTGSKAIFTCRTVDGGVRIWRVE